MFLVFKLVQLLRSLDFRQQRLKLAFIWLILRAISAKTQMFLTLPHSTLKLCQQLKWLCWTQTQHVMTYFQGPSTKQMSWHNGWMSHQMDWPPLYVDWAAMGSTETVLEQCLSCKSWIWTGKFIISVPLNTWYHRQMRIFVFSLRTQSLYTISLKCKRFIQQPIQLIFLHLHKQKAATWHQRPSLTPYHQLLLSVWSKD